MHICRSYFGRTYNCAVGEITLVEFYEGKTTHGATNRSRGPDAAGTQQEAAGTQREEARSNEKQR